MDALDAGFRSPTDSLDITPVIACWILYYHQRSYKWPEIRDLAAYKTSTTEAQVQEVYDQYGGEIVDILCN